jgi:hypothetical protein
MRDILDDFEEIRHPARLRSGTERTVSAFVSGLRERPGRGGNATISANLNYLDVWDAPGVSWGRGRDLG